ncbi:MAG: hypothetical protein EXR63_05790 [Dehalococcoidia bacterium]|nr:hypothetical protein [Dehalococcoidia bacterium]
MGFGRHLLVLGALIVNLWLGGELVEALAGRAARDGFELLLMLGYALLVLRVRLPWRRDGREPPGAP